MTGSAGNHPAAASIWLASIASRAAFRRRSATASHDASTTPTASAIAEIRDGDVGVVSSGRRVGVRRHQFTVSAPAVGRQLAPSAIIATGNVDNAAGCRSHVTAMTTTNAASPPPARRAGLPREHSGEHEPDDPQRHRELDDDVVGVEDDRHPVVRGVLAHEVRRHVLLDRSAESPEAPSEHGTLAERRPPVAPHVEPSTRLAGRHATGRALAAVADRVDEPDRDERAHDVRDRQLPPELPPGPHRDVGEHEHGRAEGDPRSGEVDGEREDPDEPEHERRTLRCRHRGGEGGCSPINEPK